MGVFKILERWSSVRLSWRRNWIPIPFISSLWIMLTFVIRRALLHNTNTLVAGLTRCPPCGKEWEAWEIFPRVLLRWSFAVFSTFHKMTWYLKRLNVPKAFFAGAIDQTAQHLSVQIGVDSNSILHSSEKPGFFVVPFLRPPWRYFYCLGNSTHL